MHLCAIVPTTANDSFVHFLTCLFVTDLFRKQCFYLSDSFGVICAAA